MTGTADPTVADAATATTVLAATDGRRRNGAHPPGPLGPRVLTALLAASRKIEQLLPGVTTDVDALQTNPGAVNQLLDWLVKPAAGPLRQAARTALDQISPTSAPAAEDASGSAGEPGSVPLASLTGDTVAVPDPTYGLVLTGTADATLAAALTGADLGDVTAAAGVLRRHLDDARRARRQGRRRRDTPPA